MLTTPRVTLGDVCKVISGYAFKSAAFKTGGSTPVIKIKNIKIGSASLDDVGYVDEDFVDKINPKFIVRPNDILISLTGSHMNQPNSVVGRVGRYPNNYPLALLNQRAGKIIPNKERIDSTYLFYVLLGDELRREIAQMASGAASQANISPSQVESITIPLPTMDNQIKIGSLLQNYDNLIENNNRRIAILEDMTQSLYREWFVKFLYPGNVKNESPLESSTKGWNSKPLEELVNFKRNTIKKGSVPPKTPYMGLEHFPRKSMALENWDEVDEIGSNKLAFERGDILFGKIRPNFHKVGVAQIDGLCSSDTFVLSPVDSDYHALISMVTFSDEFVAQAVQTSQGSKMPRASWDVLKEFPVCIPPQDILNKFNAAVTPAIEQVRVLSLKNRNLKKQRDMLLPKLISGDIEL